MGIATFESELKLDMFFDEWLNELEENIESDPFYDEWCAEQITKEAERDAIFLLTETKPCILWLDEIEPILKEEVEEHEKEKTACERIIEGYKDLTSRECDYIFDTLSESKRENI